MLPPQPMVTIKNRVGTATALGLLSLAVLTGCGPPGQRALLDGQELLRKGQYAQALPRLKTATELLSTNALAWNDYGLACHRTGQPIEAEKAYQRAIALHRELAEARFNLGCLFLEQNRLEAAKSELTAFTLRRPNEPEGFLMLARVHLGLRELNPAERAFGDALKVSPQNAEALNGLGMVRLQRGKPGEAVAFFNSALKQQANYGPALLNLAIVSQTYLRDKKLALQKYAEYLALGVPPAESNSVAAIIRQLERELAPPPPKQTAPPPPVTTAPPRSNAVPPVASLAEATPAITKAATSAPTAPPKATVVPKPEPPVQSQVKAPKIVTSPPPRVAAAPHPTNPPAPSRIAVTPPASEKVTLPPEPAVKTARDTAVTPPTGSAAAPLVTTSSLPAEAKTALPQKKGLLRSLNPLNLLPGSRKNREEPTRVAAARKETVTRVEVEPSPTSVTVPVFPRYHYTHPSKPKAGDRAAAARAYADGVEAQSTRRFSEAVQSYRAAIQSDPDLFEAHYNLGLALTAVGKLPDALAAYETALSIVPDSLDARFNFALVLQQANYVPDAATELEKVLARYPNETRARLALGNLYAQQLQQPAAARPHYLKVLEIEPQHPQASAIRYWLAANP